MTVDQRHHVWRPGSGQPLLLLHGTGGDEEEVLDLHDALAPAAPALSVRGSVVEDGMYRHFARLAEGVLDEEEIARRVDELAEYLEVAAGAFGIQPGSWVAVGFSNGANLASATILRRPEAIHSAVLFGAMPPFVDDPTIDLSGHRVLISNGRRDPLVTAEMTNTLARQFRDAGADVTELPHDGGHERPQHLFEAVRNWLRE